MSKQLFLYLTRKRACLYCSHTYFIEQLLSPSQQQPLSNNLVFLNISRDWFNNQLQIDPQQRFSLDSILQLPFFDNALPLVPREARDLHAHSYHLEPIGRIKIAYYAYLSLPKLLIICFMYIHPSSYYEQMLGPVTPLF